VLNNISASPNDRSIIRRLSRAALVAGVALACILAAGQAARAADEEEEEPVETRILKAILGINDGDAIDYRERAPLVVPPSMNLVPPEQAKIDNPAWPKDADVQEKKKKKAAAKNANQDPEIAARRLSPAELDRGRLSRPGSRDNVPENPELEGQRPLRPGELGYKGGLLGALFKDNSKPETAVFTGEPARSSLTAPPPGYMTPSPSQPYGLSAKKEAPKPYKLEDHGTSQR
jgi:microcompartment protein CcmK/EutM